MVQFFPRPAQMLSRLLTALLVSLLAMPNPAAYAQEVLGTTISVNTTTDELTSNGNCSLREAIRAANLDLAVDACPAGSGTDTILIAPGNYMLAISGTNEDHAITGDLDITSPVTIYGAGVSLTFVDGNGLDRVFEILGATTARFHNLTIRNGFTPGTGLYGGGGILNNSTATLEVFNAALLDNTAQQTGGGIDNSGSAHLVNVTLDGNTSAQVGAGGGIYNAGTLFLENVTISNNSSVSTGGGLDNSTNATLVNVTISNNSALSGGALFSDGDVDIVNSTIYNNSSGIHNQASLRIKNTIVANSLGLNCAGTGSITSLGYNLDSASTCGFTGIGDQQNADPLLAPLGDNQGPTYTHALLTGSPAIDMGDNIDCPPRDQRGAFRPADGDGNLTTVCDIGAFEANGSFPYFIYLSVIRK